ncbi:tetratricopeptide repeat protein [Flavobacterium urocaniciphilum]|uniref:Tetratricopeptide repeat-containing protein n=1 Tax=Flavobacterium urocaniciphilum TaxID=1299341 RepID=A0A1H9C2V2_9FLAO|nr:tetratricopeptide repeat protein [Flavobacterium urocaniciphilum]SEP95163.1 Tetratricopeptide repeat-containing protein [Flavobacterium urocaniciphilum]
MKRVYLASIATLFTATVINAQDLEQVKKSIDAEKYSDARKTLKSMVNTSPDKGKNFFYLGQVYLALDKQDSAKVYFEKGKNAKDAGHLNLIGLAHINLINGNKTEAQANIASALASAKKKDVEEQIFISRAYLNSENPDFSKAVEAAKKAVTNDPKSAQAYLALGDAQLANKNTNDAYVAYRTAFELDNTLYRAKTQLAVITRNAQAFPEAMKALKDVVALNPNYGPAYREMAETNLAWAFGKNSNFQEKATAALENYKKYMSLTDTSVDSRMKYADFLILTKDWKGVEAEALAIQKMDKVNPRVLRYLGYASLENGNSEAAIKAINEFIAKSEPKKVKGRDYSYLGKAKLASAMDANGVITNANRFNEALADLVKASELDPKLGGEFSELGVKLYKQKAYFEAAKVLELALKNSASKSYTLDNYYYGNSVLYHTMDKTPAQKAAFTAEFERANNAFAEVIKASATTQDAYFSKAQLNRVIDTDASKKVAVTDYEGYISVVNAKGEAELSKESVKKNLVAAYTFIGSSYSATDKTKAIEAFEQASKLNPTDKYISESLSVLKKK